MENQKQEKVDPPQGAGAPRLTAPEFAFVVDQWDGGISKFKILRRSTQFVWVQQSFWGPKGKRLYANDVTFSLQEAIAERETKLRAKVDFHKRETNKFNSILHEKPRVKEIE